MTVDEFMAINPDKHDRTLIAALTHTIKDTAADIESKYFSHGNNAGDFRGFLANMDALIGSLGDINDYFDVRATGAFKECYTSGIPQWIIKFYTEFNHTAAERQILDAAHKAGIGKLFLPTYFIEFPFKLNAYHIDNDDQMEYDEELHDYTYPDGQEYLQLIGCELQPQATVYSDTEYVCCTDENNYLKSPVRYKNGEIVSFERYIDLNAIIPEWHQAIINTYGDDFYNAACKFAEEFCLTDLHSGNIGFHYADGERFPVIVDWLSRF